MTASTLARAGFDFGIVRTLSNIGNLFVSIAAAQQATSDFEQLNNRTDAQLSAQGLRRSDLSRVVFDRHFS